MLGRFWFWLTAKRYRWTWRVYGWGVDGTFTYTLRVARGEWLDVVQHTENLAAVIQRDNSRFWEWKKRPQVNPNDDRRPTDARAGIYWG